jgi:hypothetical protein
LEKFFDLERVSTFMGTARRAVTCRLKQPCRGRHVVFLI